MMCLWLYIPVMLSFVSSAAKTLLPELFKDISSLGLFRRFLWWEENIQNHRVAFQRKYQWTIIHSWFHCYWWHSLYILRTNEEMWPSTWQFGWCQNIDVCNNETHINKYWSWTMSSLSSYAIISQVAMLLYPNMAEQLCLIQKMQHKIAPSCMCRCSSDWMHGVWRK